MSDDLWSVHAPSDDYIAVPSFHEGERLANAITRVLCLIAGTMPDPPATVQPWPYSADEHQRLIAEEEWPDQPDTESPLW